MRTTYLGIHMVDVPPHDFTEGLKWNFGVQFWYNPTLALVKTSVLLFLLRLGGHKPSVRRTIHSLNAFNVAMAIAVLLAVTFQCSPIAANWDPSAAGARCIDQGAFYVASAVLNLLTDVAALALPFWVFLGLNMAPGPKAAIIAVFLLGAVVPAVGCYRVALLLQQGLRGRPPPADPSYTIGIASSAVECNLAVITASAPALRGLSRRWFPRMFSRGASRRPPGAAPTYYGGGGKSAHLASGPAAQQQQQRSAAGSRGSSYALRDLGGGKDGSDARVHAGVRGWTPTGSDDDILAGGIVRTTTVTVHRAGEETPGETRLDSPSTLSMVASLSRDEEMEIGMQTKPRALA